MTQSERTRFTILLVLLIVLIVAGVAVDRFVSKGKVGADTLGSILNQATATYKTEDGIDMETSFSDISTVNVSSGVNKVTVNYLLEKRTNQSTKLDIQFYTHGDDTPKTTIVDKRGETGVATMKLKNIANGYYDIAAKPLNFLSQVSLEVPYANGKASVIDFKKPFLWGDIDKSHSGKGDNVINNADWSVLVSSWEQSNPVADINADDKINNADASVLLNNWGKQGLGYSYDAQNADIATIPDEAQQ